MKKKSHEYPSVFMAAIPHLFNLNILNDEFGDDRSKYTLIEPIICELGVTPKNARKDITTYIFKGKKAN
jgi:hypothetical protein